MAESLLDVRPFDKLRAGVKRKASGEARASGGTIDRERDME
jgi:hypothetical protein